MHLVVLFGTINDLGFCAFVKGTVSFFVDIYRLFIESTVQETELVIKGVVLSDEDKYKCGLNSITPPVYGLVTLTVNRKLYFPVIPRVFVQDKKKTVTKIFSLAGYNSHIIQVDFFEKK